MKHFITLFLLSCITHNITPCAAAQATATPTTDESRFQTPPKRSTLPAVSLADFFSSNPQDRNKVKKLHFQTVVLVEKQQKEHKLLQREKRKEQEDLQRARSAYGPKTAAEAITDSTTLL